MVLFLLMPAVVYIPAGIYFYRFFKRFLTLFHIDGERKKAKILSVLFAVFCALAGWWIYGFGAVVILHFLICSLLMDGINIVVRKICGTRGTGKIWNILYKSGIVSVLIVCGIMAYGVVNMGQVRETVYSVQTVKPLENEIKIAQITDLHMGTTMGAEKLKEYAGRIQEKNPDMLVLTGDIFDESTEKQMMEEAAQILGNISTTYGVYYVWGNHDPNRYVREANYSMEEMKSALQNAGIRVLEDEAVQVTPQLTVIGRVDTTVNRDRKSIQELLQEVDRNSYVVLLDHKPVDLQENAAAGVDLQLSGHTHAGQIWPTGQLSELVGIMEKSYGMETIGDFHAIVSSGIAGWGYPIRTGGHSEYVITTVSAKPGNEQGDSQQNQSE